jgi:23S rRNA (adenine2503-C2)-methyltransferase
MVKLTPVNPTENATRRNLAMPLAPGVESGDHPVIRRLREQGFETVVSAGDDEENALGSNCGQVLALWRKNRQ